MINNRVEEREDANDLVKMFQGAINSLRKEIEEFHGLVMGKLCLLHKINVVQAYLMACKVAIENGAIGNNMRKVKVSKPPKYVGGARIEVVKCTRSCFEHHGKVIIKFQHNKKKDKSKKGGSNKCGGDKTHYKRSKPPTYEDQSKEKEKGKSSIEGNKKQWKFKQPECFLCGDEL
ncbi:hypothetical protein Nepgr_011716 [Nepenthes gracilis]|uniref:Uncharacterized protein n=1 Tax=Nepenthes gracilis TaxID=150966 RepID=A0AAD3SEK6_NEPGR|nr:hypothetical protein Nepgr_011716 [Nepenthes gracilis]